MDKIRIVGGYPLYGRIAIEGAKNAALPLMAASILIDQKLILEGVPPLADIAMMTRLLENHGAHIEKDPTLGRYSIQIPEIDSVVSPYDIVRKMRASILVLGPLLARTGQARVSLPGGCAIGTRPIDLHIKGLEALGAEIKLEGGYIEATAPRGLKGARYVFPKISVTGTANLMMAACLANGTTELIHAAREPEVSDLANCLNRMGAKIEGIGTDTLIIQGVSSLHEATHTTMPDRIEMGTYMMAVGLTGGDVFLERADLALLPSVHTTLEQAGLKIEIQEKGVRVSRKESSRLQGVDIKTDPFPGFATDLQAQFIALMSCAEGTSFVTETIFENRFMHVPELVRMGAEIRIDGRSALIRGIPQLRGAPVMATDLRASVSLVLGGLAAEGETTIQRVYHLDRGYHAVEEKLSKCGAKIERIHSP